LPGTDYAAGDFLVAAVCRVTGMLARPTRARLTVLLLFLAVLAVGCGGGDDDSTETRSGAESGKTFSDDRFSVTFTYPDELKEGEVEKVEESAGAGKPVARAALGMDSDNLILLTKYELNVAVTSANLPDVMPELDGVVGQLAGSPVSGEVTEVGGLPAARYDVVALDEPPRGESRLLYVFDQTVEYQVNCQSTPEKRAELNAACDQVLATLRKV
jgi:hypothetical protein